MVFKRAAFVLKMYTTIVIKVIVTTHMLFISVVYSMLLPLLLLFMINISLQLVDLTVTLYLNTARKG